MTAIVGIAHEGGVLIGGDSLGSGGWSQSHRADGKVFRNGPFVMGFTTSYRMGQLLRYRLTPPTPRDWDLDRFMATDFVDAVRQCLKDHGWMGQDDHRDQGGQFLVGVERSLYVIGSDFQIGRSSDGYDAVGCGQDLAQGSLHTTAALGWPPMRRAEAALRAAEHHSNGVGGPFAFELLGPVAPLAAESSTLQGEIG